MSEIKRPNLLRFEQDYSLYGALALGQHSEWRTRRRGQEPQTLVQQRTCVCISFVALRGEGGASGGLSLERDG
jgi:hypothetical protein